MNFADKYFVLYFTSIYNTKLPIEMVHIFVANLVQVMGLEPTRQLAEEPKSSESTNSTIPAYLARVVGLEPTAS